VAGVRLTGDRRVLTTGSAGPARLSAAKRRVLGITIAAVVLVATTTLGAARVIKSPAQAAAEAVPPPPSVITARVERRVLVDTVVVRGMVSAEQTIDVLPRGGADAPPVVTEVRVKAQDLVEAGTVLVEVSGRPVIALPGQIPAYRDLRPGSHGRDVRQLQTALQAQGFASTDPAGYYGEGTKAAVSGFYHAKGYEPPPASDEDDQLLEEARDQVTQAQRALRDARTALELARQEATARPPGAGDGGLPAAGSDGSSGTGGAGSSGTGGAGPLGLAQAEQAVLDRADDLSQARRKLAAVRERTGPMAPASELVFLRRFPARVDTVHVAVGSQASGKLLTVSAGRLVVRSQLSAQQRQLVRPGQQVELQAELLGTSSRGKVLSVADMPSQPDAADAGASGGTGEADPSGSSAAPDSFEMVAVPTARLDPRTAGQDVRVTVVAATTHVPVLTVPLAAVSAGRTVGPP
jgi:HlyD family secretion protein